MFCKLNNRIIFGLKYLLNKEIQFSVQIIIMTFSIQSNPTFWDIALLVVSFVMCLQVTSGVVIFYFFGILVVSFDHFVKECLLEKKSVKNTNQLCILV